MQRPATIACQRCGNTVTVRGRGPVPAYCAQCRSQSKSGSESRPDSISCRLCGSPVDVKSRGPLPKQCRGKCENPAKPAHERRHRGHDTTAVGLPPSKPPPQPEKPRRPRRSQLEIVATTSVRNEQITRLDVAAEAQRLATPNYGLHVRLSRMRQTLSIGLWLLVIVTAVLIFVLGSQPAPPELEGLTP